MSPPQYVEFIEEGAVILVCSVHRMEYCYNCPFDFTDMNRRSRFLAKQTQKKFKH